MTCLDRSTTARRSRRAPRPVAAALLAASVLVSTLGAPTAFAQRAAGPAAGPCPIGAARVGVSALGAVALNGTIVPADKLAPAIRALQPPPTEICYFREPASGGKPAAVAGIVQSLISLKLPISFYADPKFTQRSGRP
ncbi:MAG: hypothetical protein JSR73_19405 [Proteobacteria bacterium]|nr:hypothetical protein [Pseudomonadota bacterium]